MKLKMAGLNDVDIIEEREELFKEMIKNGELNLDEIRRIECGNFKYSLQEVLLVWLCGIICGFKTYGAISWYGQKKIEFFKKFFPYENGCPSRSTIARVVGILNSAQLDQLLEATVKNAQNKEALLSNDLSTIAIDGKTTRGMQITNENQQKLHMVSAFDTATGLILAQEVVSDKSNEIIAIKNLLPTMNIENKTITIDAMGTHKEITQIIRAQKGNYILPVKDNQKKLHQALQLYFNNPSNQKALNVFVSHNKGHGRIEKRTCYSTSNTESLDINEWADLGSIIMVKSERTIGIKSSTFVHYFITNLIVNSEKLLRAIRAHWGVEAMHYLLDVTLDEDARIVWNKNIAENESIGRRIALNLLKQFRETYRLHSKTAKESYWLIQTILFYEDDKMEALLRSAFK